VGGGGGRARVRRAREDGCGGDAVPADRGEEGGMRERSGRCVINNGRFQR
jgi:hypothetical protein